MRRLRLMLLPLAMLAASPALAADAAPEAALRGFIEALNRGDIPAAAKAMAAQSTIVDEVPPYRWSGTGAFAGLIKDFGVDERARGISAMTMTLGSPSRAETTGAHAYLVVPATYRFLQKGVKMIEPGHITATFVKVGSGWKISTYVWSGPAPTPE